MQPHRPAILSEGQGRAEGVSVRLRLEPAGVGPVGFVDDAPTELSPEQHAFLEEVVLQVAAGDGGDRPPLVGARLVLVDIHLGETSAPAVRTAVEAALADALSKTRLDIAEEAETSARIWDLPPHWFYLGLGLPPLLLVATCPFAVLGGGMSALVHELGHTVISWFFGRPAVPAVVMTLTLGQSKLLAVAIWGGIAFLAWHNRGHRVVCAGLGAVALIYPLVAFSPLHDTAILLGGHGTELIFSGVFLIRAMRGGMFHDWERPVWATFGWYLWGRNTWMCVKLLTNPIFRETYRTVAFTGDNDLVVVAERYGLRLETVATGLLVLAIVVLPAAIVLGWRLSQNSQSASRR